MPLVRITLAKGRPAAERRAIADGIHHALVSTAGVPADDRFQVVQEVPAGGLIWDPTYLGSSRTAGVVFVEITLNAGRTVEVKQALYAAIAHELARAAGVRPDDVLVNLVEVPRENWSFGRGLMSYPPAQRSSTP
jgi:phenylpyruvate tautomerase PptA (4-oxalocrotonate tautomerase family)